MANKKNQYFEGKDMFMLPDGSTYHLGAKEGEIPQRILTVGSNSRAESISQFLQDRKIAKQSSRGFGIYVGKYNDVDIAIISIGMGAPMMDFMVREASFVQNKELALIRLGTCGILNPGISPGTVILSGKGAAYCQVNYPHYYGNAIEENKNEKPFSICKPAPCDQKLNSLLEQSFKSKNIKAHNGLSISCETFYACQGRKLEQFDDLNDDLLKTFSDMGIDSLEMETHQLFHQAHLRKTKCHVAAAAIGLVNRSSDKFPNISPEDLHKLELEAGKACLVALSQFKL